MSQVLINSLSLSLSSNIPYTSVQYVHIQSLHTCAMATVVVQCVSIKGPGDEANLPVAKLVATYLFYTLKTSLKCHWTSCIFKIRQFFNQQPQ